jgi:hypothetical protein
VEKGFGAPPRRKTPHRVIYKLRELLGVDEMGGTMRLGAWPCKLEPGSSGHRAYGKLEISERHRYEFNRDYERVLTNAGLRITGRTPDENYVEIVEAPDHPWFLGCQFHAEFKSKPLEPHPLFAAFVVAALVSSFRETASIVASWFSSTAASHRRDALLRRAWLRFHRVLLPPPRGLLDAHSSRAAGVSRRVENPSGEGAPLTPKEENAPAEPNPLGLFEEIIHLTAFIVGCPKMRDDARPHYVVHSMGFSSPKGHSGNLASTRNNREDVSTVCHDPDIGAVIS